MPELPEVSSAVRDAVDRYRDAFIAAKPFKHVMIENFFEAAFAEALLAEFPSFDKKLATNEGGETGGKAVQTNMRAISPAYQRLYDTLASPRFLEFASRLSGIPDLLLDPKMFGGGTHENLHGQELDAHVDFNYDEARQLHRRLNMIVYLNKDWRTEWGGAIQIHSNPRRPAEDRIESFDPLFNRLVMFETNEYSWHGFPKIQLPEEERHRSRKSISIYLYTKTRPSEETAPLHGTFYVQRPLPAHIREGHTLTADDVAELQRLLIRRDRWIELYQNMELTKNRDLAESAAYAELLARRAHVPFTGYVLRQGDTEGLYGDEWVSSKVCIRAQALQPVTGLLLRGFRPAEAGATNLKISVDGVVAVEHAVSGYFELPVPVNKPAQATLELRFDCDSMPGWGAAAGDDRDLAFILLELRAEHPPTAARK